MASLISSAMLTLAATPALAADKLTMAASAAVTVTYSSVRIDGLKIAYREAGDTTSPKLVLLHGLPNWTVSP